MNTESIKTAAIQQPPLDVAGQPVPARLASIDIFRGLTMLVMIFVNDLDSVKGLPWWTYHAPGKVNAMTYVDMVFPAFLFIVGMSMPLAIASRLKKGASMGQLWAHVILRTISLLVLGLILANAKQGNRNLFGVGPDLWAVLALLGAVLFWNVYGRSERYRTLFRVLKFSGLGLMIAMFAIYRRTTESGQTAWISTGYWEILGLIGWAYLAVAILYIPSRRWRWAPLGWFVLLLLLNIATTAKWIAWPHHLPHYLWPFGGGASAMIVMAGVVTSILFRGGFSLRLPLLFAGCVFVAGWLLTPLGISKIRGTPTWCLYSIGACVLLFMALYWICDVKRQTRWASFVRPAGVNTLLTYLVPDLYYYAFWALSFTFVFQHGWPGVIRAAVFTAVMLAIAALLTKWRVRMQL